MNNPAPTSIQMPWVPDDPTTPKAYLLAYVASRRFSHVHLAAMLGVTRMSVHRWLRGATRLTYGHMYQWRLVTRAMEAATPVSAAHFPGLYRRMKRNQTARGEGSASGFYERLPEHPGYAERRTATIAELFAGKPDMTIEIEGVDQ